MAGATVVTEGPMEGWQTWPTVEAENFGQWVGPIYWRRQGDNAIRCVIETSGRHRNGYGALHGGFLSSCADMALFSAVEPYLVEDTAVTSTLTSEFLGTGRAGTPIEGAVEVLKSSGKLMVVRGVLSQEGKPIMSFTGTLRKVPVDQMLGKARTAQA